MNRILSFSWLLLLLAPAPVVAQGLPTGPIQLFDGRVRLAGEVSGTLGPADDDAFFNYTDYENDALRTFRAALSGLWRPASRVALLAQLRADGLDAPRAHAAYIRVRPLAGVPVDLQAGRVPPVFGAFGRQGYGVEHMVIGYPLAYQYLTSIRPDAVPATADNLIRMKGRGWRSSFPVGSADAGPGVPLISAFRWDTGIQAHWSTPAAEASVALTTGTLSNPRLDDDNDGRQIAGRVAARPVTGLVAGVSAARGAWVSGAVPGATDAHTQTALGADAEYSRDHWLIRGEVVWSRWRLPFVTPPAGGDDLSALAAWIEGRYRITPRVYVAARADRLGFSTITGSSGVRTPWDAPVTRLEAGAGYLLQRNLVLRATLQHNQRDGGRVEERTYLSTQVAWWF